MKPHYPMVIEWSADDNVFVVTVPDLPGCMAHGSTPARAAAEAQVAIRGWLEVAGELGRPIPPPRTHIEVA
ncbi:MAG: type II toxin-antitoxin system HicB family antitoxin [bacterium]